jgi:hypothetical protein
MNVPSQTISFGVYGAALREIGVRSGSGTNPSTQPIAEHAVAAAISGAAQAPFINAAELIKILMQNQTETVVKVTGKRAVDAGGRVLYTGSADCMQHVVRTHGVQILGRGLHSTMWRDTSGILLYFVCYEAMRRRLLEASGKDTENDTGVREVSPMETATAGAAAGVISWAVIYPADVIKTRCQSIPPEATRIGVAEAVRQILAEPAGWRGLFRGCGTCIVRALPANAVTFLVYEQVMSIKSH